MKDITLTVSNERNLRWGRVLKRSKFESMEKLISESFRLFERYNIEIEKVKEKEKIANNKLKWINRSVKDNALRLNELKQAIHLYEQKLNKLQSSDLDPIRNGEYFSINDYCGLLHETIIHLRKAKKYCEIELAKNKGKE